MAVDVRDDAADREPEPAELRQDRKHRLVGRVVADEYRLAALERWIFHQFTDRAGFVDPCHLDLEYKLAGQDFDRAARRAAADPLDGHAQIIAFIRRQPVVQGERIAFVFDQNSGAELGQCRELALERRIELARARHPFPAGHHAQLRAMAADGGELQRRKDQVDVMERASRYQRQGAAGQVFEPRQRVAQLGRHEDLLRRRS